MKLHRTLLAASLLALAPGLAAACPFCSAIAPTFSEEIASSAVAVVAKMTKAAPPQKLTPSGTPDPTEPSKARFEIVEVLKGQEHLGQTRSFEAIYFGEAPVGGTFLVMGLDPPQINWATPIAANQRVVTYVRNGMKLPKEGPDRLVYFMQFFEDSDEMLSRDCYDEFARAPYAEIKKIKDQMPHAKLVEWIKNPQVQASRRRLYLTFLALCGTQPDAQMLEDMMKSKDDRAKRALDAMVAAYLTLKGPAGLPLIEELFLKNKDAEYTETYAAIQALRFHGQEETVVPRERLAQSLRLMLERPQLADIVVPDLARWQDWSVMPKLVELFKKADEQTSWIRVPVINYLRACPDPKAKTYIAELEKIDPDAVKRANTFFPFGAGAKPAAGSKPAAPEAAKDKKPADAAAPAVEKPPANSSKPTASALRAGQGRPFTASRELAAAPLGRLARAGRPEPVPASAAAVVAGLGGFAAVLAAAFTLILRGSRPRVAVSQTESS